MNISTENVHCSIANCHLEEVPEPKLCLERSTELVVDGIILAVRQHQLQKCAARGHHGSRNRVDSRSIDQVCTVINDVVKVKEVKHLRGKFNAFVFSQRERLQQPQIDIFEPAIAICVALHEDARRRIRPVRGRGQRGEILKTSSFDWQIFD